MIAQNYPLLTTIELDFNQFISNDVIEKFGQKCGPKLKKIAFINTLYTYSDTLLIL
jgi:hypothetical protein